MDLLRQYLRLRSFAKAAKAAIPHSASTYPTFLVAILQGEQLRCAMTASLCANVLTPAAVAPLARPRASAGGCIGPARSTISALA